MSIAINDRAPSARPSPRAAIFGVATRRQSYMNLLYLLVAFPLGTAYFIFLVTGLSSGIGMIFALIGIPLMVGLLYVWRWLGAFERQLTMWWLGIEIAPMSAPLPPGLGVLRHVEARLRDRVTWTSLLYLFVAFPFGVLGFVLAVVLISFTSALLISPVAAIVQLAVDGPAAGSGIIPLWLTPLLFVLGLALGLGTLHTANALAWVWGRFAQFSLGMSDTAARLAEAQAARARAEAQAARAEQSRRELIVNASHELRTPIASIRGHAESLLLAAEDSETGAPPPEELRGYLGIIARESERLSGLVDDLLALARADAGELRLEVRPTELAGVVEEVFEALAPLARRERQVTLVREIPAGLPLVLADRERLAQVLLNLVRNGISYTPAGGLVSISAERDDPDHVALVVADTGIGIPPEELSRVFERFYRTDASRARASGGFGLGLSIVRDLVEAMGGTAGAESVTGQGSRFRVVLRIATPSAMASVAGGPERTAEGIEGAERTRS
jgi:two-component system, OmpR family, phosphate regulon sensor histidine kinase PhoR